MRTSTILFADAMVNLALGLLLLPFPAAVARILGVPAAETPFYASLLGAVLVGIGIALLIECFRRPAGPAGLGLGGAVAINLCGGLALAGWLALGDLDLPLRGRAFLWGLVAVLVVFSGLEVAWQRRRAITT